MCHDMQMANAMEIVQSPCKWLKIIYLECENFMQGVGARTGFGGEYVRQIFPSIRQAMNR
jgi:hypothetical protein